MLYRYIHTELYKINVWHRNDFKLGGFSEKGSFCGLIVLGWIRLSSLFCAWYRLYFAQLLKIPFLNLCWFWSFAAPLRLILLSGHLVVTSKSRSARIAIFIMAFNFFLKILFLPRIPLKQYLSHIILDYFLPIFRQILQIIRLLRVH